MPRAERNAPTLRILRILDEVDSLEVYCETLFTAIAETMPEIVSRLPPAPVMSAVIEERAYQRANGHKVRASRNHQRRLRAMAEPFKPDATSVREIIDAVKVTMARERLQIHPDLHKLPDGVEIAPAETLTPEAIKKGEIF